MDTTFVDALVGRVLDGRYAVEERLARGGMATVYRAVDLRLDRVVAVKVMHPALAEDAEFVARFIREAKAAARLSHPHVVAVFDQGADGDAVFLVMEYVDGRTLRDLLRERGRLSPAEAVRVLEPVLGALAAAHAAGLVHRDVKPENVLISRTGQIKVADFGLARAVQGSTLTATSGVLMGTVAYLAPEQVERGGADPRSDVYAAGILLYELLVGAAPYAGETALSVAYRHVHDDVPAPSATVADVPAAVDELVRRATRRDPAGRPRDAAAFLAELVAVKRGLPDVTLDLTRHDTDVLDLDPPTTALPAGTRDRETRAHTRVLPVAAPAGPPHAGSRPAGSAATARRRRRRWPWLALLLLLTAAAAVGGVYAAGLLHRVHYVVAPNVKGDKQAVAEGRLISARLHPKVTMAYDLHVPAGIVLAEKPTGRMPEKSTVTLVVSNGPKPVTVPDVSGDAVSAATATLQQAGLVVKDGTAGAWSESLPKGDVIRTEPTAKSPAHQGDPVTLVVSRGPKPIPVPTVAGLTTAKAEAALRSAGFTVGSVSQQFSDTVDKGHVISSSPSAGQTGQRGDQVSLVVSKGPDVVTVPSVVNENVDQARHDLQAAGLTVRLDRVFGGFQGHVIAQSVPAGEVVKRGTLVTLAVV